jgi:hypothetical protein
VTIPWITAMRTSVAEKESDDLAAAPADRLQVRALPERRVEAGVLVVERPSRRMNRSTSAGRTVNDARKNPLS